MIGSSAAARDRGRPFAAPRISRMRARRGGEGPLHRACVLFVKNGRNGFALNNAHQRQPLELELVVRREGNHPFATRTPALFRSCRRSTPMPWQGEHAKPRMTRWRRVIGPIHAPSASRMQPVAVPPMSNLAHSSRGSRIPPLANCAYRYNVRCRSRRSPRFELAPQQRHDVPPLLRRGPIKRHRGPPQRDSPPKTLCRICTAHRRFQRTPWRSPFPRVFLVSQRRPM